MNEWEQQEQPATQAERVRSTTQRVYGRGLFDGLRMAGITQPENFMKEQRLTLKAQGLSSAAQRVLEAVPIAEAWQRARIVQEMHRGGHCVVDVPTIDHNLGLLRDRGLIREHPSGTFQRITGKPHMELVASVDTGSAMVERVQTLVQSAQADPLAQLGAMAELANNLRVLAKQLCDVADGLEASALASEERLQRAQADAVKLLQLRDLFRSIGGS